MLTFERTQDLELVRKILTEPSIYPHVGDDFSGPVQDFRPNGDERIWQVLAISGYVIVGLLTFIPRSTVLWEAHIALLPGRKTKGTEILAGALQWMFDHSTAERIIGEVPACNRMAVNLAKRVMRPFGINAGAFRKHGELQDLMLFGISKGKTCQV